MEQPHAEAVRGLSYPAFRERYELPDGLHLQPVPVFDEIVVREPWVNALMHRPCTRRGDIFLTARRGR